MQTQNCDITGTVPKWWDNSNDKMSLMGGWTQALQKRQAEEKRRGHCLLCEGICEGVV